MGGGDPTLLLMGRLSSCGSHMGGVVEASTILHSHYYDVKNLYPYFFLYLVIFPILVMRIKLANFLLTPLIELCQLMHYIYG